MQQIRIQSEELNVRQLTLAEVKENKEAWAYGHPQHKKITNWITEMMALDSQPFFIVEDVGFLHLLANVCPKYVMLSRKYFSEKIIPGIFLLIIPGIFLLSQSFTKKFTLMEISSL